MRAGHGSIAVRIQAGVARAAIDLLGGILQRPPVGLPPGGTGPQAIPAGKLDRDLPVVQPERAHLLSQSALLRPQAGLRVRHVRFTFPGEEHGHPALSGLAIKGSRPRPDLQMPAG
jgi:hypothetical protein